MKKCILLLFLIILPINCLLAFPDFSISLYGSSAVKPSSVMRPVSSFSMNYLKGDVGEYLTNLTYMQRLEATGWRMETPRATRQGLDHLFFKFDDEDNLVDLLVVESKYRKGSVESSLGNTASGRQMSEAWTSERIKEGPLKMLNDFTHLEESGDVILIKTRPDENSITSKIDIGKDSYYYTIEGDDGLYFYSSKNKYDDSDNRLSQVRRLYDNVEKRADRYIFKRRVADYKYDIETNTLTQTIYTINTKNNADIISPNTKDVKVFTGDSISAVLDSNDFKTYIQNTYGLEDFSFYDGLTSNEKMKLLNNNLDLDIISKTFNSKKNKRALNNKLGLNPYTDLTSIDLSASEWKKILAANSINDLDDSLSLKVRNAEKKANVGSFFGGTGIAAITGVTTNLLTQKLIQNKSWKNINWTEVVATGGIAAAGYAAQEGIEIAVRKASRQLSNSSIDILKKIGKIGDYAPFIIDAAIDLGLDTFFALSNYKNGTYSLKQTGVNLALNVGIDAAATGLSMLASNVVAGAIGGSVGGPIGIGVGIAVSVAISFGSYYVVDPIMKSIEVNDIFAALSGENCSETIMQWTNEYLGNLEFPTIE